MLHAFVVNGWSATKEVSTDERSTAAMTEKVATLISIPLERQFLRTSVSSPLGCGRLAL
uniref:Uncharacterized protein n=1 Tax=Peronospora matthiolae TaxID=2874970 RepID=A0AAV1UJZ2_9STRA